MRRIILFSLLLAPAFIQAQIDSINVLKPAAVKAVSSDERSPFAHTDVTEEDIIKRDAAQDLPFLIRFTPSVVVTSDAGNGIGYTGMRLRGTDATRINVTINGVPLNDAESMGVWWVDLPDLGSSVSDLQISRGVGTSTNGPSAFGGSIAINTLGKVAKPLIQAKVGMGSFGSQRLSGMWNTGILDNGISFDGRVSQITSDGYMNRASSELFSVYGSVVKRWEDGKISFTATKGEERTYQSWYGVPEIATKADADSAAIADWAAWSWEYGFGEDTARVNDLLANGRQHNYYSYENEVDDYAQDHHQLHIEQQIGALNLGFALFQTLGSGYYEQERLGDSFSNYGIEPYEVVSDSDTVVVESADFIRRRWLDNQLRGGMLNASFEKGNSRFDFGGMYSIYNGDHFGKIVSQDGVEPEDSEYNYYFSQGNKTDLSAYTRLTVLSENEKLRVQAEAQIRKVDYATKGLDSDRNEFDITDSHTFFNPKIGFDLMPNANNRLFASLAVANREPSRNNYLDAPDPIAILPENLRDLELGYRFANSKFAFELGAYHMQYTNQLIPTGTISDTGAGIKMNVDESYRQGIEVQAGFKIGNFATWQGNATISNNKIVEFTDIQELGDSVYTFNYYETDIAFSPSLIGASILTFDVWDGGDLFSDEELDVDLEFASKYVGKQYLDNTSSDDRALPSYLVHDIVVRCNMVLNGREVDLSIFANNVFDHLYSANGWSYYYLYENEDGGVNEYNENYVYPQAGRNGFISLSVKF